MTSLSCCPLPVRTRITTGLVFGLCCLFAPLHAAFAEEDENFSMAIFLGNADGSDMKRLTTHLPEYQAQGSPDWSEDGTSITFDAWKPQNNENYMKGRIFVVNADGTNPRDLGEGNTPSISPRGRRVTHSRPGIWVVDVDNSEVKAQLDPGGWGTEWSPDGTRIAYARGHQLIVYSLVEGTSDELFDDETKPFQRIFWNFTWSPDGREIAFKGVTQENKTVLAIVNARGADQGLRIVYTGEFEPALAWHPSGDYLLLCQSPPDREKFPQLYKLDLKQPGEPTRLPNQPTDRKIYDPAFSPDGTKLLVCMRKREPPAAK